MKRFQIISIIFWIGLSIFLLGFSYKLGLGGLHNPGPGLMPFLLGLLLLLISFYVLIRSFIIRGKRDENLKEEKNQINFRRLSLVVASLFAYGLLLEILGFLITTSLILILLFHSMGFKRWSFVLLASAFTVLITYFLFTFLGTRFPAGVLRGFLG